MSTTKSSSMPSTAAFNARPRRTLAAVARYSGLRSTLSMCSAVRNDPICTGSTMWGVNTHSSAILRSSAEKYSGVFTSLPRRTLKVSWETGSDMVGGERSRWEIAFGGSKMTPSMAHIVGPFVRAPGRSRRSSPTVSQARWFSGFRAHRREVRREEEEDGRQVAGEMERGPCEPSRGSSDRTSAACSSPKHSCGTPGMAMNEFR